MSRKRVDRGTRNTREVHNNRANQLNPNNDAYWKVRGHEKKPSERNQASSTRKNKN